MVAKKKAAQTVLELLDSIDRGVAWELKPGFDFPQGFPMKFVEPINKTLHEGYAIWCNSWIRPHLWNLLGMLGEVPMKAICRGCQTPQPLVENYKGVNIITHRSKSEDPCAGSNLHPARRLTREEERDRKE